MTNDEMIKEKNSMSCGWKNGHYIKGTPREEKRLAEFNCIDMINSLLAYGNFGLTGDELIKQQENSHHNYLLDHIKELGKKRVSELIDEQNKSINYIGYGGIDGEGSHYNSIEWK